MICFLIVWKWTAPAKKKKEIRPVIYDLVSFPITQLQGGD